MIPSSDRAGRLAQNLVELLSPYEEELIELEREFPQYGPLRRALGIAIAEACYAVSDRSDPVQAFAPPADDTNRRAR